MIDEVALLGIAYAMMVLGVGGLARLLGRDFRLWMIGSIFFSPAGAVLALLVFTILKRPRWDTTE